MANIVVNPIPYTPGDVAVGAPYTPDGNHNYITIPNVDIAVDLQIPPEKFAAQYAAPTGGKAISHAMAVITEAGMETVAGEEFLKIVFSSQVFFTDDTRDNNVIEASIKVNKPSDFNTFTIVGPFNPVILPMGGVSAAYNAADPTMIDFSISIEAVSLPVIGTASVRVQVATGKFV